MSHLEASRISPTGSVEKSDNVYQTQKHTHTHTSVTSTRTQACTRTRTTPHFASYHVSACLMSTVKSTSSGCGSGRSISAFTMA